MLGAQGSPYLQAEEFSFNFGYRWQHSERHFTGDHEDVFRETERSQEINDVHLMDFGLTYAPIERINATVTLPVLIADRSVPILDANADVIGRDSTQAQGIGDMILLGQLWVLDPAKSLDQNISIGIGPKFPTGQDDVRDRFRLPNGSLVERTVDQSIQPGDGGFGFIADIRAFKLVFDTVTLFAQGTYLFNPRDTNGVPTFRGRPSEEIMSVPDAFQGRLGAAVPIPWIENLSFSLGGRVEGVPVYDLIGDSNGFRRPGIAVSIEPGLVYTWRKNSFAVSFPVAIYRNRFQSAAEKEDDRHGDAAFADFLVLFSFAHRFGGPPPKDATCPVPAEDAAEPVGEPEPEPER